MNMNNDVEASKIIYEDMVQAYTVLWDWFQSVIQKSYWLLGTGAVILLIYVNTVDPRNREELIYWLPIAIFAIGLFPSTRLPLMKIPAKWQSLQWSDREKMNSPEILEKRGKNMVQNIKELKATYEEAKKWITRARSWFLCSAMIASAVFITIQLD